MAQFSKATISDKHCNHFLFAVWVEARKPKPHGPQALHGLSNRNDLLVCLCFCFVIFEGICIKAETACPFELKNPFRAQSLHAPEKRSEFLKQ